MLPLKTEKRGQTPFSGLNIIIFPPDRVPLSLQHATQIPHRRARRSRPHHYHCRGQYMAIGLALGTQKDTRPGGMARLARVIASKLPHHVIQRSNEVYCPRQFRTQKEEGRQIFTPDYP